MIVVSDPIISRSGCAVMVKAGSSQEPKEVPGLAHFLEHMLFFGSKKYPKASFFHDFLA